MPTFRDAGKQSRLRHFLVRASKRSVETPDQALFAEGLFKIANSASRRCAKLRSLFWKSCNKNCGHLNTSNDQPALKVDTAQAGHLHVGDQAGSAVHAIRLQELFSRRKSRCLVAKRSYEPFGGLSHGLIIVDNRDQGRAPHSLLNSSITELESPRLHTLVIIQTNKVRDIIRRYRPKTWYVGYPTYPPSAPDQQASSLPS